MPSSHKEENNQKILTSILTDVITLDSSLESIFTTFYITSQ